MNPRLSQLLQWKAEKPDDAFLLYAIAMEFVGIGDLNSAKSYFLHLLSLDPEYLPAYYHFASCLIELGEEEKARELYLQGIALSERLNQPKTRNELITALNDLNDN